jgi:putative addiction module component (TIGR02574 family)
MSKDAVITEIMSLQIDEQYEVLRALQERLASDLVLEEDQEQELDRRIARFERGEGKTRRWEEAVKSLETHRDSRHLH